MGLEVGGIGWRGVCVWGRGREGEGKQQQGESVRSNRGGGKGGVRFTNQNRECDMITVNYVKKSGKKNINESLLHFESTFMFSS